MKLFGLLSGLFMVLLTIKFLFKISTHFLLAYLYHYKALDILIAIYMIKLTIFSTIL